MSEHRYRYAASLSWGGDEPTAELEVEVAYAVAFGTDVSDSEISAIHIVTIDGLPVSKWEAESTEYMPGSTVEAILDKLEMDHETDMLEAAFEQAGEDHAEALDRRDEAAAERRAEGW